jgi:hypothetical protein
MRARTAIAGTSHRVRLTVVGWGLTTMLACVALSACTSSPSTSPVTILSPTVSDGVTVSVTVTATGVGGNVAATSASASTSVSVSSSPSPSASPSPSPSASPSPSPSFSPIPTAAPVTGGGGTAGFQNAGLAVLGGAAIVAGLGSIAYRRRMTKRR